MSVFFLHNKKIYVQMLWAFSALLLFVYSKQHTCAGDHTVITNYLLQVQVT